MKTVCTEHHNSGSQAAGSSTQVLVCEHKVHQSRLHVLGILESLSGLTDGSSAKMLDNHRFMEEIIVTTKRV